LIAGADEFSRQGAMTKGRDEYLLTQFVGLREYKLTQMAFGASLLPATGGRNF
jgi:hypothetical protein